MAPVTWRRVHPVTPVVKGWKMVAAILVIGAQQAGNNVRDAEEALQTFGWGIFGAVLVGLGLLGFVYAFIAWRMTRYAIDDELIYLQTGVVFRKQRSAPLDRIQAIDVVQPVLARILGLAELKIEVAGGHDSAVRLSFLKEDAAQALRNSLLARAAGLDLGPDHQRQQAPAAPEREVLVVPVGRLVVSLLRSFVVVVPILAFAATVAVAWFSREVGAVFGILPVFLGSAGYLWQRFSGEFHFRAAQSPDGVRLRHGLLEARAQTVPPGRVQAVRLTQPFLWRGKDWWRVQINVAGYGKADEQQTENVLLPVGERSDALLALWLVLPDLGAQDPRGLLDAGLSGEAGDPRFVTSPRPARWLDPWAWHRNGYTITDRALLVRRGRFNRELVVVPHARTQSLGVRQGPLQRRLGVASVTLHSTPGPIRPLIAHLEASAAGGLMVDQAARARQARAAAGPERWMLDLREQARAALRADAPPARLDLPIGPA